MQIVKRDEIAAKIDFLSCTIRMSVLPTKILNTDSRCTFHFTLGHSDVVDTKHLRYISEFWTCATNTQKFQSTYVMPSVPRYPVLVTSPWCASAVALSFAPERLPSTFHLSVAPCFNFIVHYQ